MKFVVTGGAGFIGSNLVRSLVSKNHTVLVIDNLCTGKLENLFDIKNHITFKKIDIRDFDTLSNEIKNMDGIFHQAALTNVSESYNKSKEYYDVNVQGTKNIFKIAKKNNQKVVYASSSNIYGNVKKIPISENTCQNPINPYGQTKFDGELLANIFSKEKVRIIGLRYFNVFGMRQTNSHVDVISKFMERLSNALPPIINGTGEQTRDFIYVNDVVSANLAAMNCNVKFGFFNVGTGRAVSMNNLATIMIKLYGLDLKPEYTNALDGDINKSQADPEFARKFLNWKYKIELEHGLSFMINHM